MDTERTYGMYGCVKCQTAHMEGDALYTLHLPWQSKHGVEQITSTQLADYREVRHRAARTT